MTQNSNQPIGGASDLTFITNEAGQSLFFRATRTQQQQHASMPREVILSSWIISGKPAPGKEATA